MSSRLVHNEQHSFGADQIQRSMEFGFSTENRKQQTENIQTVPTHLALWLIRAYQLLISPLIPNCCRFAPSCSHYAAEALRRYGLRRGLWLSLRRLARCHPFHPGGWDPVP